MGFEDLKIKQKFAWSYSRYTAHKQCPAKYRYQHILKLPEERSPALLRGGKIHELMARIMEGEEDHGVLKDIINGYPELKTEIQECVSLFRENGGGVEQQLAINNNWDKSQWFGRDTWCRGIIDLFVKDVFGKDHAYLVDWKTGKFSNYNLKNYEEQLELFCAILFANDASIKTITPVLFFLDAGIIYPNVADKIPRYKKNDKVILKWQERAMYMENDNAWTPTPNNLCGWCSFSKKNNGPCKVA